MEQTAHQSATAAAPNRPDSEVDALANLLDCLSLRQFCSLGRINEGTAEAWRKRGTGPAYVRLGNTVLYPRKCVADYLQQNVRERRAPEAKGLL